MSVRAAVPGEKLCSRQPQARVVVHAPSAALAPFVNCYWYFETEGVAHTKERVLPSGTAQLLVNLHEDELRWYDGADYQSVHRSGGAAFAGPQARHYAIDTAEQKAIIGVHFNPIGVAPFLGMPACVLAGRHISTAELWSGDGSALRARLLEATSLHAKFQVLDAVLLAQLKSTRVCAAPIAAALRICDDPKQTCGIGELAARFGWSNKRMIAQFREVVGLTPKRYFRVRRFQNVLEALEQTGRVDWAAVAGDCGYYDQAHLIRDFSEFSGLSPSVYLTQRGLARNHVPLK